VLEEEENMRKKRSKGRPEGKRSVGRIGGQGIIIIIIKYTRTCKVEHSLTLLHNKERERDKEYKKSRHNKERGSGPP
jgi:hypothetical protein